jgi:HAMP domain-containing protein
VAPVVSPLSHQGAAQIGTAAVVLSFDETVSVAAKLRRLIWPLMGLAIVAITLITYFLFRHLVYQPIDRLLLSMAQAEAGNLAQETDQQAPDEIGLLASRFDRMLNRIRQITSQLELEQNSLKARVCEDNRRARGQKTAAGAGQSDAFRVAASAGSAGEPRGHRTTGRPICP